MLDSLLIKLNNRIEDTGGNPLENDYLFKHIVLLGELSEKYYEKIAKKLKIDFISVEMNDEIDFIHVANIDSLDFIEKNGLQCSNENWKKDLGYGIYVISNDENHIDGLNNLKTYVEQAVEENEILVITGTYSGKYSKCVYGENHEGYIVLRTEHIRKENLYIEKWNIDDFLLDY